MATQRQIDANRRNAAKSTGPKSAEGKARSRLNGLTHGLRSDEVVLPTEDTAAFAAHLSAWMADWQPPTMARHQLVERLAVTSWRLKRCVRVEALTLSKRVNASLSKWDRREDAAVDRLVEKLRAEPLDAVIELQSTRAGVLRLIDLWDQVATAAEEPDGWFDVVEHHHLAINLMGHLADDAEVARQVNASWSLLLRARPDLVEADGDDKPMEDARAESVRGQIVTTALHFVGELRRLLPGLPDDSAERAAAAEVEAFAPRKEDAALRRYEGQLDREFRAGLNQLVKLSESGADLIDEAEAPTEANPSWADSGIAPTPGAEERSEPSPLVGEGGVGGGDVDGGDAEPPAEPEAPTEPNRGSTALPMSPADRDRDGRTWPLDRAIGAETPPSDR